MGARETASRQSHQPLPAHLDVSAGIGSGPLEKYARTIPGETRFSLPCNPLPVSTCEIKACSGSKPSATDPLHPNSNEIKVCSGVAERTPFFVEKSKAALLLFFTPSWQPRKSDV